MAGLSPYLDVNVHSSPIAQRNGLPGTGHQYGKTRLWIQSLYDSAGATVATQSLIVHGKIQGASEFNSLVSQQLQHRKKYSLMGFVLAYPLAENARLVETPRGRVFHLA